MNRICLIQGGGFLLGVDVGDIASRTCVGAVRPEGRARMVDLGALLSCRPGKAVSLDAPCLELRGHDETFFLIVDWIGEEVEVVSPPVPLPSACPDLTARLYPQATVCGTSAVPLLNPAQVIPVCAHLGKGIGLIAEEEWAEQHAELTETGLPASVEAEPPAIEVIPEQNGAESFFAEPEELPLSEEKEPAAEQSEQSEESEPEAENEVVAFSSEKEDAPLTEEAAAIEPEDGRAGVAVSVAVEEETPAPAATVEEQPIAAATQEKEEKTAALIDEETFKKIIAWTIARFKQSRAGEDVRFGVEQLPSDLAETVRQKGLGRNVIQYLIDQIVLRCQESVQRRIPGEQHGG